MKEKSEIQLTDEQMEFLLIGCLLFIEMNYLIIYMTNYSKRIYFSKDQVSNSQVKTIYNLIVQKL